ncbi:Bypass of stop codon protein 6 [Ceratobasidium sp. AG-Ba]|nr:Bypass of stop codon protein 6 [Ceratobasidium sp. AG-Ba]
MSGEETDFDDLLLAAPTNLRDRRTSIHAGSLRPILSDGASAELHTVPHSMAILSSQEKDQSSIAGVLITSKLPGLHIDRQSASIQGYAPSTTGQGLDSTASTPEINHFNEAYGPRSTENSDTSNPRLKHRLAISFFGFFCTRWSDGTTGIVLPLFEETYHTNILTFLLLFVARTVGYEFGIYSIQQV